MTAPSLFLLGCVLLHDDDMARWQSEHEETDTDTDTDTDSDSDVPTTSLGDAIVYEGRDGDSAGHSVAGADVDDDGFPDMIIGAPTNTGVVKRGGAAYLVLGSDSPRSEQLAHADTAYVGSGTQEEVGYSVGGAGDFNGDGFDDVIVGAPENSARDESNGVAYLLLGGKPPDFEAHAAWLLGTMPDAFAGDSVAGAGDVNGDGFADVIIGAPGYGGDAAGDATGAVFLMFGTSTDSVANRELEKPDARYLGEAPGDRAGDDVASAGDVDGDGLSDILIGAPGNGDGAPGAVYLVLGGTTGSFSLADADAEFTGGYEDGHASPVAGARDVDGDGTPDVVIGAPGNSGFDAGTVWLVLGGGALVKPSLTETVVKFTGELGERAGCAVALMDLNGDDFADVVIGASGGGDPGTDAGSVYVVRGSSEPASVVLDSHSDARYVGESGDLAGGSLSGVGDVNRDGVEDLLIGAQNRAFLVLGR